MTSSRQDIPAHSACGAIDASDPAHRLQHTLGRVLKSLVFRGDPNSPLVELPVSQLKCLYIIAEHEGQKMIDLAHRMEVKLPALSQIVDRLAKRGLVERHADPQDRRVVRMALTDLARALVADAERSRQARMSATVRNLTPQAMESVVVGLQLLAEAAEKQQEEEKAAAPFLPDTDPRTEIMTRREQAHRQNAVPEVSP